MTDAGMRKRSYGFCRRSLIALSAASCLLSLPGCALREWFVRKAPTMTRVLAAESTREEILDHLNDQRSRLVGWRSTDIRVKARGEGIIAPSLSASLSVESPRRLRLVAESLRGSEVDFGSNDEQFWFWMRAAKPKYMLTGSHESMGGEQATLLPFPPIWLMDSLGVLPIDPSGVQMMRDAADPDRVRLISTDTLQGRRVQRIMLVDLTLGEVVEHALYDDQSRLIVNATMGDFRDVAGTALLPHRIEINFPQGNTELNMKIGQIEINPSFSPAVWVMQTYDDYRVVNLDDGLSPIDGIGR